MSQKGFVKNKFPMNGKINVCKNKKHKNKLRFLVNFEVHCKNSFGINSNFLSL